MRHEHKGSARTAVLTTALGSSTADLTIICDDLTGWPTGSVGPFYACIDRGLASEEKILCLSRSGNVLTVYNSGGTNGRAFDDTSITSHAVNAVIEHVHTAQEADAADAHIDATTGHGATGAVVGTTNTQTLTNKTIDGDNNTLTDIAASSVKNRPINAQSGTGSSAYSFALADARKHVVSTGGSSKTFTIPLQATVTWLDDAAIPLTNTGAGVLTVAIAGGGTLNGSDLTLAQGESAVLLRTASDVWWCLPFSSGGIPRGTLSGTTGSPTTSSNGGATAYKWTSSGNFTVATAGLFSGLVVGGGGGGGKYGSTYAQGGGGGGGQVLALTDFYLAAGTYTVTVGAGGAASVAGARPGNGETSVLGPFRAAGGGCGSSGNTPYGGDGANGGGCDGQGGSLPGRSIAGGYTGGDSSALSAAGGGAGAGANGSDGSGTTGGAGGAGVSSSITGSSVTYGGGGGGGGDTVEGAGGSGGGGAGGYTAANATAGSANTGGGGGGCDTGTAGAGGSGVVILLVGTV